MFSKKQQVLFKKLNTPNKIQDYLNSIPFNFEEDGIDTIRTPYQALKYGSIHCFEGALLGAYILSLHGHKPLILHLKAEKNDFDHMLAIFQVHGRFGALSKTNHYCLRYRDPVYKSIRELVMSYFHEYFLNKNGKKTLRSYSKPLDLSKLKFNWIDREADLWELDTILDKLPQNMLFDKGYIPKLRPTDAIERKAGNIVDFKPKSKNFKDPNLV